MNIRYILAVISISLIGCAEQYNFFFEESEYNIKANKNVSSGLTKSVCNNDIDSVFFVSEKDLDSYLQFKKLSHKNEELTVVDITPITDPQMYVSNFSSTAWNYMASDDDVIAALIAHVGICVSMSYGDSGSGAYTNNLLSYFWGNNILCIWDQLNSSTYSDLYENILNGLPVVASATSYVIGASGGHSFIIDGYKNLRVRISTFYTWVPDDPQTPQFYDDRIKIMYTLPFDHQITMNWGWGNDYPYDAGWYSTAGDWHVASCEYDYDRHILYNFCSM